MDVVTILGRYPTFPNLAKPEYRAMTGWDWHKGSSDRCASGYFNLPFFMKAGCVERATVSASGSKISCGASGHLHQALDNHIFPRYREDSLPSCLRVMDRR